MTDMVALIMPSYAYGPAAQPNNAADVRLHDGPDFTATMGFAAQNNAY